MAERESGAGEPALLDCHCHAWRRWPYAPLVPDEDHRGTVEQLVYEMDMHGVEQALVVCAAIENNADNIEYVAFAQARHPGRLHVVADLDCTWSETYHAPGSAERLRALDDRFGLAGLAHYTAERNDGWLLSDEAEAVFQLAEERRLIVSLGAGPAWHADLRQIARRHPAVPILCHSVGGVRAGDDFDPDAIEAVLRSAEVPNIYLKAAGFHYCSPRGWDYPWPDVTSIFERIVDAYGPGRFCWGSDFPASTRFCTYRQSLEVLREHCGFFSSHDLRLVLGETLRGLLGTRTPAG
jgi:predicted TIM-barrel fold metal-dependent hydrolase